MQGGISEGDVRHVARLARLRLEEDAIPRYRDQLERVLGLIEAIGSIDLSGVAPMEHVGVEAAALRADEPSKSLGPEVLEAAGRRVVDGQLVIPPIVELEA
jgi:aspartyl-tRNA(Asn)/glutamyl-tRNA(Gln) amidotransferase subunit C